MKIVLAEDQTLLRESLTALLERLGHEIIASLENAPDLVEAALDLAPDLIITDVRMPPRMQNDGLLAALEIRKIEPRQPILVMSQFVASQYLQDLLESPEGGIGYLLKDRIGRISEFSQALDIIASGGVIIDPAVISQILSSNKSPLSQLTAREFEVLEQMAEGKSNRQIREALTITEASVSKHIGNIFMKLGLSPDNENRRVQAVLSYLKNSN